MNGKPGFSRGVVQIIGFVALAALPVLALNSLAGAAAPPPQLTDAQKQCLADHGVTLPARPASGSGTEPASRSGTEPADGSRPELTQEQRDARRQAAEACGLPVGPRGQHGPGMGTV